jgi:glycosyltransferase involved in cell wall biosynthesis
MPEISVIIPTHKRPKFLKSAIESVIGQNFRDWELIIVDDNGAGTIDQINTAKLIQESAGFASVIYLIHDVNKGGSAARNTGWRAAKGDWICFLDNDDFFFPEKLEKQINFMKNELVNASVCRFESFKAGEKMRVSPKITPRKNFLLPFVQGKLTFASGSTMMLSRHLLERLQGFDERFGRKQDVEFLTRVLAEEKLGVINNVLVGVNIDDRSNIPTVEKFSQVQQLFQNKFESLFSTFSEIERKGIRLYDQTELAKIHLWNKDIQGFLKVINESELSFYQKIKLFVDLSKKFITYYLK